MKVAGPSSQSETHHMLEIGSVRFVSKFRNCFPFFEKPLTSVSEVTNILSLAPPSDPPAVQAAMAQQLNKEGLTQFEAGDLGSGKSLEYHLQRQQS